MSPTATSHAEENQGYMNSGELLFEKKKKKIQLVVLEEQW